MKFNTLYAKVSLLLLFSCAVLSAKRAPPHQQVAPTGHPPRPPPHVKPGRRPKETTLFPAHHVPANTHPRELKQTARRLKPPKTKRQKKAPPTPPHTQGNPAAARGPSPVGSATTENRSTRQKRSASMQPGPPFTTPLSQGITGQTQSLAPADEELLSQNRALQAMVEKLHNDVRARFGVHQKLKYDSRLAKRAKRRAHECANICKLYHANNGDDQSNLYAGPATNVETLIQDGVRAWANNEEHSLHNLYTTEHHTSWTYLSEKQMALEKYYPIHHNLLGHLRQLVWHTTRRVGCAYTSGKTCPDLSFFVCVYDPPGNVLYQTFNGKTYQFPQTPPTALALNVVNKEEYSEYDERD